VKTAQDLERAHGEAGESGAALSPFCPYYHRAVELIGRRWTGAIVRALLSGTERFSDLVAAIPGLSDRLLSERLKELEAEGVVLRTVVPETPVRIQYRLTDKGRALAAVVDALSTWAYEWVAAGSSTEVRGDACGGPKSIDRT
jgi:DNA-binding HxlR family transcriptional regulator